MTERVILERHSQIPPQQQILRENNSSGLETVQLFAGLYYMRDTNLPKYLYMARRSS